MSVGLPPIIYVMGPSGAGKDSILHYARTSLAPSERIAFAHRYITRPPDASGENHVALSVAEFEARRAAGLFIFYWQAHDTRYGIGVETEAWRRAGFVVVMNGSRQHFFDMHPRRSSIVPIVITAPQEIVTERLARRGREPLPATADRIERTTRLPALPSSILTIENSASLEAAGRSFVEMLRKISRQVVTV